MKQERSTSEALAHQLYKDKKKFKRIIIIFFILVVVVIGYGFHINTVHDQEIQGTYNCTGTVFHKPRTRSKSATICINVSFNLAQFHVQLLRLKIPKA